MVKALLLVKLRSCRFRCPAGTRLSRTASRWLRSNTAPACLHRCQHFPVRSVPAWLPWRQLRRRHFHLASRCRRPAWAASGWLVATMPCRAKTSERVWSFQYHCRSPRTASIVAAGFGISVVGRPKGVGDGSVFALASAPVMRTSPAAAAMPPLVKWRKIPVRLRWGMRDSPLLSLSRSSPAAFKHGHAERVV